MDKLGATHVDKLQDCFTSYKLILLGATHVDNLQDGFIFTSYFSNSLMRSYFSNIRWITCGVILLHLYLASLEYVYKKL